MRPSPATGRGLADRLRPWGPPAASALALGVATAVAFASGRGPRWAPALVGAGLAMLAINALAAAWLDRRRWDDPVARLAEAVRDLAEGDPAAGRFDPPGPLRLERLVRAIEALRARVAGAAERAARGDESWLGPPAPASVPGPASASASASGSGSGSGEYPSPWTSSRTRSGMFEPPPSSFGEGAADASGDFPALEMVSRLDPETLRWLESSHAEQVFLGWPLAALRSMSFPDILHPDDRELARDQLLSAVLRGEAHGLIYRLETARGERKAIEMNVGVRYGADMTPTHLRCHVTDVTAKVKASRELRRRTRELIRANEQLRRINRELQELKDRYGDLYQNAPAMYFSLDDAGRFLECNATLLRTLGVPRDELIGRHYASILAAARRGAHEASLAEFLRAGYIELESQWRRADGSAIDVWVTASVARDPDGTFRQARGVAQDVTARRVLEAELREKNDRLARANVELSRKNKELDEFSYVVSHDLQEPLRTLIAFSDFLMRDCGDRLDDTGREYVRYLVAASRRMRALIHDLLNLSRAGRVTADFAPVDLEQVIRLIRDDFAELIRARVGQVRVSGPLPIVLGDRSRIGQLFGNLISNGLKYHRGPGPVVEVGALAGDAPDWATLVVKDNGIGIDPRSHAKIFQMFRRLHTREEFEGTGAGLAICQKIVQAHGGRIWVESQLGQGATFFLTLPLPSALVGPPPPADAPAVGIADA